MSVVFPECYVGSVISMIASLAFVEYHLCCTKLISIIIEHSS